MKFIIGWLLFAVASNPTGLRAEFASLDESLVKSESQYHDIVAGTEKTIRWYNNSKVKTAYSIVYIHGFSASRQELSPTTELLADKIGANVFYARLSGHGRSDDAMAEATVSTWKQDAMEALNLGARIGEKVILVSASTGSTLATWLQTSRLAGNPINQIAANIMVSPNFGVKNSSAKILTWPGGLTIAKWINSDYKTFKPENELHSLYWTERYPLEAVVPMLELVEEVFELDKSSLTIPQLLVYSPRDRVVDVDKIKQVATQFSSASVSVYPFTESLDPSQHVLSGDACSPNSTATMVNLMADYISNDFTL